MKKSVLPLFLALIVCFVAACPALGASGEQELGIPMDQITTDGTPICYNEVMNWITFYDNSTGLPYILERKTGNPISEYDICYPYSDGMALVGKIVKDSAGEVTAFNAGFIDMEGNQAIPLHGNIEGFGFFSEGLAPYVDDGGMGFIDKTGTNVIPSVSSQISYIAYTGYSDGLAYIEVGNDGLYEYIDTQGDVALPPSENYAGPFAEGRAPYRVEGNFGSNKYGYIDKSGELVIPADYHDASVFINGIARVAKTGDNGRVYGYINTDGKEIIPLQYKTAEGFWDKITWVEDDEGEYLIDKEGNVVLSDKDIGNLKFYPYREDGRYIVYVSGLIRVRNENGAGFIDTRGNLVVPTVYEDSGTLLGVAGNGTGPMMGMSNTLFWVKNGNDFCFFDSPYNDEKNSDNPAVSSTAVAIVILAAVCVLGIVVTVKRKRSNAPIAKSSVESAEEVAVQNQVKDNFCPSCGAKLPPNSRFCPSCGKEQ